MITLHYTGHQLVVSISVYILILILHSELIEPPVILQPRWVFKRLIALNYATHSAYYGTVKLVVIWPMQPSFRWPEVPLNLHIINMGYSYAIARIFRQFVVYAYSAPPEIRITIIK